MTRVADIFAAHFCALPLFVCPLFGCQKKSEHVDNITNQAVACNPMQFGDGRNDGAVEHTNWYNRMKPELTSKQLDVSQSQDGKNVWRSR